MPILHTCIQDVFTEVERNISQLILWGSITPVPKLSSVQSLSRVRLFATPWIAARQASLSITNSRSSLRLTSIESVMPSSHLILCRPLLLLPPIPPSIRVFSNESTLHEVTKVLEFQLSHRSFQRNPRADLLQNGLVGSPCSPRDSQESSPTPQFKSIKLIVILEILLSETAFLPLIPYNFCQMSNISILTPHLET